MLRVPTGSTIGPARSSPWTRDLVSIDLSMNKLCGQLPGQWLAQVANLQTLRLNDNGFTGMVPETLSSLASLETLDLTDNMLSGTLGDVAEVLSHLSTLRHVGLGGNRFHGSFAADLFLVPDLEVIAGLSTEERPMLSKFHTHSNPKSPFDPIIDSDAYTILNSSTGSRESHTRGG